MDDLEVRVRAHRRAHGRCSYCARALSLDDVRMDLRVPLARGGGDRPGNVAGACAACIEAKGQMTAEEYKRILRQIGRQRGVPLAQAVDFALAFGGYRQLVELVSALWVAAPLPPHTHPEITSVTAA